MASKAAIARPAHEEAISHLEHAIELIEPAAERGDQAAIKQLDFQLGEVSVAP